MIHECAREISPAHFCHFLSILFIIYSHTLSIPVAFIQPGKTYSFIVSLGHVQSVLLEKNKLALIH